MKFLLKCKFAPRLFIEFIIIFEQYLVKGKLEILIIFIINSSIYTMAKRPKNHVSTKGGRRKYCFPDIYC